ncbi:hypothetical protein [Candidatus Poriferisodalis sp.]|uniref:hypothetical protein n=1 Tax=Candidatus Poriferisodalis sp. TaxID=3101277 RepID=UPI003B0285A3
MTGDRLVASLRELVREHGLEQVSRSLHEIGGLDGQAQDAAPSSGRSAQRAVGPRVKRKRAATALERVEKMDLPSETADDVVQLAKRFDEKSFMPTFGDIAHFCSVYDIEVPASRSRASAIARVFSTIAAMSAEDIRILVDYGAFSGPARLGPISDAIARRSRTQA